MSAPRGDRVSVSVLVAAEPAVAFEVFTEEIDQWWRRGLKYRLGRDRSVLHIEPRVGGALFETFHTGRGERTQRSGTVLAWEPPSRLVLEWRAANFREGERTEVEVRFEPSPSGTRVTVTHTGWSAIPGDHPVRHGEDVPTFVRRLALWWGGLAESLRQHVAERSPRGDE